MTCRYCGKEVEDIFIDELNGNVCDVCYKKLQNIISFSKCCAFESALNRTKLNDAFRVVQRWFETEFKVVRFYEFKNNPKQNYETSVIYIAVKEMKPVKFPLIIEVKIVGLNKKPVLKVIMKDDTKKRNMYIFGNREDGTLASDSDEIQYVKTDMKWVEEELKEFL